MNKNTICPVTKRPFYSKIDNAKLKAITYLLKAEKLIPKIEIMISPRLIQKIYTLTNGNPFWIAHLGELVPILVEIVEAPM